jgi:hypothetical protein
VYGKTKMFRFERSYYQLLLILSVSIIIISFNFLEPSGPLQACNGTALPLPLLLTVTDLACNSLD